MPDELQTCVCPDAVQNHSSSQRRTLLKRQTIIASSVPLLRISSIITYLWVAMDERRCDDEKGKARVPLAPA
jgi:hypothetical protein